MPRGMLQAAWFGGIVGLLAGDRALAQINLGRPAPGGVSAAPVIEGLSPPGATVGKTTEWTVKGKNLEKVTRWIASGTGVQVIESKSGPGGGLVLSMQVADDAEPGFRELRALAPDGFSNLVLFRVDPLPQAGEAEPNDDPGRANPVEVGSVAVGLIRAQDVDYYRVEGRAGRRIAIDLEARRLGSSIAPVVTVLTPTGAALAQGREIPGAGQDCRLAFTFPEDGSYLIQVRDNTYSGSDTASYRLRLDPAPFATGLFPLGGPRGQSITVTASGGNLSAPRSKTVTLPETTGTMVDPGPFDGPDGASLAPARLAVGDGPELDEAPDGSTAHPMPLDVTVNGRLDRPGEVDRYTFRVKAGQAIHVRIEAAVLGSWLDSVVTLRDEKGALLAENDDPTPANQQPRAGILFGIAESPPDSRLDYQAKADGELTIEVADRYGDGGPEYAYRLAVGAARPDFSINLLLVNPAANRGLIAVNGRASAATPGSTGALNLRPGGRQPINFLITPARFDGSIEVRAEGLPPGVTADPVTIRMRTGSGSGQPVGNAIELRVAPDAEPAIGELRLVAEGKPAEGVPIRRTATMAVRLDTPVVNPQARFGPPPIMRVVPSLPVAVTGTARPSGPRVVGPPRPIVPRLKDVSVAGPLLQGGRLELALALDPAYPPPGSFALEAQVKGRGLLTQTIIVDEELAEEGGAEAGAIVRLVAAVDAEVGSRTLRLTFAPKGGETVVKELTIDLRAPVRVTVPKEPIRLAPGGSTSFRVGLTREPGYAAPVKLAIAGLPKGVKATATPTVGPDQDGADVRLEMEAGAQALASPVAFRVTGLARMPRGEVRVDSANRPMVTGRPAEN